LPWAHLRGPENFGCEERGRRGRGELKKVGKGKRGEEGRGLYVLIEFRLGTLPWVTPKILYVKKGSDSEGRKRIGDQEKAGRGERGEEGKGLYVLIEFRLGTLPWAHLRGSEFFLRRSRKQ
jgi:hypothetical protein